MVIERTITKIKSGYSARALGLAAHGYSPEVADKNLMRVVRAFLAPFERAGTLAEETAALGLEAIDSLDNVEIVFD